MEIHIFLITIHHHYKQEIWMCLKQDFFPPKPLRSKRPNSSILETDVFWTYNIRIFMTAKKEKKVKCGQLGIK